MIPKKTFKKDSLLDVDNTYGLMDFLIKKLDHKNRNNIKTLLKNRQVLVNNVIQTHFDFGLTDEDVVRIKWDKAADKDISTGLRLIHEDNNYYVLNKEAGLLTYPIKQGTQISVYSKLLHYAKRKNPRARLYLVKSLDKDSSGLVIFCKNDKAQTQLIEAINKTGMFTYSAILEGVIESKKGKSAARIYESKAFKMHFTQDSAVEETYCDYELMAAKNNVSAVKFESKGNEAKHLIRMHALNIGYPIVGDKKYGSNMSPIKRLALHRNKITFQDPFSKEEKVFESAKPRKFSRII